MLTFSPADEQPLQEGIHFRIPLVPAVYKMPVMIKRSESESEAASSDLQRVHTTVVLNYLVNPTQVVSVYRNPGVIENVEPNIIDAAVQEAMKAVTARYTAEQLVTKRPMGADAIRGALKRMRDTRSRNSLSTPSSGGGSLVASRPARCAACRSNSLHARCRSVT